MTAIILRRLALSIPLLLVISGITFFLAALVPGDPARTVLGLNGTDEQYAALRASMNLDRPVVEQFWLYLVQVFQGDLGRSLFTNEPVVNLIGTRLPVTLTLLVLGTLVSAVVGVVLGVVSAGRRPVLRRVVDVLALVGGALPNFWVALVLISIFAVGLRWFPATGWVPFAQSPSLWALSLVLPVVVMGIGGVALIAKITRDAMLSTLRQDFVRTLRASGVSETSIVWKHALRNTGIVVATTVGLTFINFIPGTIFIESVFVLPGLGNAVVNATNQHDIPVVQGIGLTLTVIVVIVNLAVDLAYGVLNPKVRAS